MLRSQREVSAGTVIIRLVGSGKVGDLGVALEARLPGVGTQ